MQWEILILDLWGFFPNAFDSKIDFRIIPCCGLDPLPLSIVLLLKFVGSKPGIISQHGAAKWGEQLYTSPLLPFPLFPCTYPSISTALPCRWILWDERVQGSEFLWGWRISKRPCWNSEGTWKQSVNWFLFCSSHRAAPNPFVRGCYWGGSLCRADPGDEECSRLWHPLSPEPHQGFAAHFHLPRQNYLRDPLQLFPGVPEHPAPNTGSPFHCQKKPFPPGAANSLLSLSFLSQQQCKDNSMCWYQKSNQSSSLILWHPHPEIQSEFCSPSLPWQE